MQFVLAKAFHVVSLVCAHGGPWSVSEADIHFQLKFSEAVIQPYAMNLPGRTSAELRNLTFLLAIATSAR
jgi:hypothetical protein